MIYNVYNVSVGTQQEDYCFEIKPREDNSQGGDAQQELKRGELYTQPVVIKIIHHLPPILQETEARIQQKSIVCVSHHLSPNASNNNSANNNNANHANHSTNNSRDILMQLTTTRAWMRGISNALMDPYVE